MGKGIGGSKGSKAGMHVHRLGTGKRAPVLATLLPYPCPPVLPHRHAVCLVCCTEIQGFGW